MKAKSLFATVLLLAVFTLAGAVPDQPNMEAARTSLQSARSELNKATPDKGGHRANAIKLVAAAISEVNAGIAFARRHNHASSLTAESLFAAAAPDQPHMQSALSALESAKDSLDKAEPDKGGHRGKALGFVKDAIDEVKKGIDFAR